MTQESLRVKTRAPANAEVKKLEYYLDLDRFLYYVTEFTHHQSKKVNLQIIDSLKALTANYVINNSSDFPVDKLKDSKNYDALINDYLIKKEVLEVGQELSWGYNFLKRKLNQGFIVRDSNIKTKAAVNLPEKENAVEPNWQQFDIETMDPSEQTLDSEQYISDRMTRAVFWEANDSDRTVEFHPSNPREFLKHVKNKNAVILGEVKTKGSNYNKIYLVKYPNESTHRLAITNVGGEERMEHLLYHLSLSNIFDKELNVKVELIGDFNEEHAKLKSRLINKFLHLPRADRTIIGQLAGIQNHFYLNWKFSNLEKMYHSRTETLQELSASMYEDLKELIVSSEEEIDSFDITKHKKLINSSFSKVQKYMSDQGILDERFNKYEFDNSIFTVGDIVFKNEEGKRVRWRLVSNGWGDEVRPLGEALKETGHNVIDYIGTTGAFGDKGMEVGDVFVPTHTSHHNEENQGKILKRDFLEIDLSEDMIKVGGTVNHVPSPFVETKEWYSRMSTHADAVEIETSVLNDIFDGENDKLNVYLMVSDVMGSEGETLAAGSASKRKKGKQAIFDALLKRDKARKVSPISQEDFTDTQLLRKRVIEAFPKKGSVFQYYIFSLFENDETVPSLSQIKSRGEDIKVFSDNFFTKKALTAGEILQAIIEEVNVDNPLPKIALNEEFLDGKWHANSDKLKIELVAESEDVFSSIKEIVSRYAAVLSKNKKWLEINPVLSDVSSRMHALRPRSLIDDDYLIKRYVFSGMRQGGLDYQITNSGNFSYDFIPTESRSEEFNVPQDYRHLAFFKSSDETLQAAKKMAEETAGLQNYADEELLRNKVERVSNSIQNLSELEGFAGQIIMTKVDSLDDGSLARFEPEFSDEDGITINLKITQEGLESPAVILEEIAHLDQIHAVDDYPMKSFFSHPMNFVEMLVNSRAGSKRAKYELALAEIDAIENVIESFKDREQYTDAVQTYFTKRLAEAEKLVRLAKKERSVENKFRKEAVSSTWNNLLKSLDKSDQKLDDLIANNDRAGVQKLIETYMQWNEMEPSEIALWKNWIKAIGTPNNINDPNNEVLFRGLEGDLIKESADGGNYLMSVMLTSNQGSYNRRLRSLKMVLKKMRKKGVRNVHPNYNSIMTLFKGHSREPVGSSLISASEFDTALGFSTGDNRSAIAALSMNPNRLLFNIFSDYTDEVERLIPLIIFPDEIVHLEAKKYKSEIDVRRIDEDDFKSKVVQKLGRELRPDEESLSINNIDKVSVSKKWWDSIQPDSLRAYPESVSRSCNEMIRYFSN